MIDIRSVKEIGRRLIQGRDSDVSHGGLQLVLHDWRIEVSASESQNTCKGNQDARLTIH